MRLHRLLPGCRVVIIPRVDASLPEAPPNLYQEGYLCTRAKFPGGQQQRIGVICALKTVILVSHGIDEALKLGFVKCREA